MSGWPNGVRHELENRKEVKNMKWVSAMLCIVAYGIIEGSDVQGYELTSATWTLLIACMIAAIGIMFHELKKDVH